MKTKLFFTVLSGSVVHLLKRKAILSFLLLAFLCSNISAQNTANIIVTPASSSHQAGTSFDVMVQLDYTSPPGTSALNALSVHLTFDRTKLQVTNIVEQPTANAFTNKNVPIEASPYTTTNANGEVSYEISTTGTNPNTDFDVLRITFQVIGGVGTITPLTFRRDFPFNFTDAQLTGISILASPFVINGQVSITSAGCPTLPTATISNTGTCNGQPFNLVMSSATGVSPWDLVINGTTYNDIPVGGTIATFTPPNQTIWTADPTVFSSEEDQSVTLGVKFQSSVAGYVKGVRFFSSVQAPLGTYTGQLWTSTGTLLATATFTVVGPGTWNQVLFSTPVQINTSDTYVASYHTTDVFYVQTVNGLPSNFTNGSLTALANGGVYNVGGTPAFPNQTVSNSNFWVDVVFTPSNYTFNLTSITDNFGCVQTGTPIQALSVTSVNCSTLPITLVRLSATPENKNITLNWSTASEINNKGFEIQRSANNILWEGISFVAGAGNSTFNRDYAYIDRNLFPQRYYYRLKQVDIDGHYKFSAIVAATIDGKPEYSLSQNYPNPFRTETTIQYTLPEVSKVNLTIFDLNGRALKVLVNGTQSVGSHAEYFRPGSLPSGVYYYRLQAGNFTGVKKLIVQ